MKTIFSVTSKVSVQQTGFTLIEIMISLALGIVLMGGVISVFISTKQAYTTKENAARMQENVTFATNLLREMISNAIGIDTNPASSDSTFITVQSSSSCLGLRTQSSYSSKFFVYSSSGVQSLGCRDVVSGGFEKLIDNVQKIEISYGQDTSPGDGQVDVYEDAPNASTISVRIILTMILDPKTSSTTDDITQNVTVTSAIRSKILSRNTLWQP